MTPTAHGVMQHLKRATADLHTEQEALQPMRRLMDPDLSRPVYHQLLRRYYRAVATCERHLQGCAAEWEDRGFDWSSRLVKTAWLAADLAQLDPCFTPEPAGPSTTTAPYTGAGFPRAAGCLYVIEGSTLGGRVILKRLARDHRHPADGASRFFQGYGPDTDERWTTFGRELETSLGGNATALAEATVAAGETYRFFERMLSD